MVTGYGTSVIAEARQRLQDLIRGIDGVLKLQKQAKEQEQYNVDPSPLYVAARQDLLALAKDFDIFKLFINENKGSLYGDEPKYYEYKIETIKMQLDNLENTIIIPSLTAPIPSGDVENDTDVGRSFVGIITSVSDGDTMTVRQHPSYDGGLPSDHQVRVAGIDTAEGGTPRGKYAAETTRSFWEGKEVTVYYDRHTPNDLYGRVLGTVYYGDINFATWSLERCLSEPNLKFSKNHFVDPIEIRQSFSKCVVGWPQIGVIKVTSSPTHATVYVGTSDGDLQRSPSLTPCEIELPVGKHILIISSPGYGSVRDEIDVLSEKMQLPVYSLAKLPVSVGTVVVSVAPVSSRAIISIDGSIQGLSPLTVDLPVDVPVVVSATVDGDYTIDDVTVVPKIGEIKRVVMIPIAS